MPLTYAATLLAKGTHTHARSRGNGAAKPPRRFSKLLSNHRRYLFAQNFVTLRGEMNAVAEEQFVAAMFLDQPEQVAAEFERSIIRERTRAGLRAARKRGVKLGRPKTLSKYADEVRDLREKGVGIRAIGRELGLATSSVSEIVAGFAKSDIACV